MVMKKMDGEGRGGIQCLAPLPPFPPILTSDIHHHLPIPLEASLLLQPPPASFLLSSTSKQEQKGSTKKTPFYPENTNPCSPRASRLTPVQPFRVKLHPSRWKENHKASLSDVTCPETIRSQLSRYRIHGGGKCGVALRITKGE